LDESHRLAYQDIAMSRKNPFITLAISISTCVVAVSFAAAQDLDLSALDGERDATYYQTPSYRPDPRSIIYHKAQARAYQREARLASLNWYGMSNARPQAASTPFTSRYSPLWEMPGGKPYSWYPTYRWPGYVYYVR
jgi:hypothetical protein